MKTKCFQLMLICLVMLTAVTSFSQTKGFIYQPCANSTIRAVLDPNGDGYVSATSSGFSGKNDISSASELHMISLPVLNGETYGDLTTGATGGHTDLVSNDSTSTHSVSVLVTTVSGIQYLVVRFRIGKASTAAKGYTLLIDTDNTFGTFLNATTKNNPGYEKEIILETGQSGGIYVYTHNASGVAVASSNSPFNASNYAQRSIAATTNNGDADYFYDFCVPLSELGVSTAVRVTAATITSAQSGIGGTVSDFNGVGTYANQYQGMKDIISSFPTGVKFTDMVDAFTFGSCTTIPPVITSALNTHSTAVSGTSSEANGTTITVYRNRSGAISTLGTTTVTSNAWSLSSGVSGNLAINDIIYATATVSGRAESSSSNQVVILRSCSYIPPPSITNRTGSNSSLDGTWHYSDNSNPATNTTALLNLYQQTADNAFTLTSTTAQYVTTSGTFTGFLTGLANGNVFNSASLALTVTVAGCESGYSNVSKKTSGSAGQIGTTTATPSITPTTILTTATTVNVKNNDASAAYLIIYVNGVQAGITASTVAAGATSDVPVGITLYAGDVVVARAQVTSGATNYWISDPSPSVTVTATGVSQTSTPSISNSYTSASTTVTGTSDEAAGTLIRLYSGSTLIGTASVNAFGGWSITGLTFVGGEVLTATAIATGKTLSATSSSVTVVAVASVPTAPTISTANGSTISASNGIYANSTTSVGGTGAVIGTLYLYEDGEQIGSTTISIAGTWTISGLASNTFYNGGVITAKNFAANAYSAASTGVTVTDVVSFAFAAISNQVAGTSFNTQITAKDAASGGGSTFTNYTDYNYVQGTYTVASGTTTTAFTAGVRTHSVQLNKTGTWTLNTFSESNPGITGTSNSFLVTAATANKLYLNTDASTNNSINTVFGTQPVVHVYDQYDNLRTQENSATVTAAILSGTTGAILSGTTTKTAASGIATFTDLKIDKPGEYVIQFTSSGLTSVSTATFYVGRVWKGTTSTALATNTNWNNNVAPTTGEDIAFAASPANDLVLTGNQTIGSFYNSSSKQLQINGNKLSVTGSFNQSNGATIEASTSEVEMLGSSAQTVPASTFINNKVCKFTVNNSSGVTLQGTLDITCQLIPTTGTLTTGGNLVIGSDATTDGLISTGSGTISGDLIVERYFPAKRAWRIVTAPLSTTGSIWKNWQDSGTYHSGTGTLISGPTATAQGTNGLDVTTQQTNSLFTYDAVNNQWVAVTDTKTSNLSNSSGTADNKAYLVFIRGDRNPNNAVLGAYNQTTLRPRGNVQSGNQTFSINNVLNRFTLLGNPYACPIDFDATYLDATNSGSNIYRKFWFYDPNLSTLGDYVTVSYNTGSSTYDIVPSGATHTQYIQSGQGFFVQSNATGGTPTLTIKETHKSAAHVVQIFRPGTQLEKITVDLNQVNNDATRTMLNQVLANFHNSFSKAVGAEDATKMMGFSENLGFKRDGVTLAIEGVPLANDGDTMFLAFTNTQLKTYEFNIQPANFNAPGLAAYLVDSYTSASIPLSLSSNTTYQFTVTSATGSWAANRFMIVFKNTGVLPLIFTSIKAYAKNAANIQVNWSVSNESGITAYEVERSVDGVNFTKVATVTAIGSINYGWLDAHAVNGSNYYRIKSMGAGASSYTSIVMVNLGISGDGNILVYPNPLTGSTFTVQLNNMDKGSYTLNLYSQQGQKVFSHLLQHTGGSAAETIHLNKALTPGIYQLELVGTNKEDKKVQNIVIK
jgi:hypothetical protein